MIFYNLHIAITQFKNRSLFAQALNNHFSYEETNPKDSSFSGIKGL